MQPSTLSVILSLCFSFHDPATTDIHTLSLHDALPIFLPQLDHCVRHPAGSRVEKTDRLHRSETKRIGPMKPVGLFDPRSEEHTSELQSHVNLVCRLLLEKKKKNQLKCLLNIYNCLHSQ